MTPLPKRKHTPSRTGKRRGGIKLLVPTLSKCASCGKMKYPHKTCPHCGNK